MYDAMTEDPDIHGQEDPLFSEHGSDMSGNGSKLRDNLLLLYGVGLVLVATGMALSSFLPF